MRATVIATWTVVRRRRREGQMRELADDKREWRPKQRREWEE